MSGCLSAAVLQASERFPRALNLRNIPYYMIVGPLLRFKVYSLITGFWRLWILEALGYQGLSFACGSGQVFGLRG